MQPYFLAVGIHLFIQFIYLHRVQLEITFSIWFLNCWLFWKFTRYIGIVIWLLPFWFDKLFLVDLLRLFIVAGEKHTSSIMRKFYKVLSLAGLLQNMLSLFSVNFFFFSCQHYGAVYSKIKFIGQLACLLLLCFSHCFNFLYVFLFLPDTNFSYETAQANSKKLKKKKTLG